MKMNEPTPLRRLTAVGASVKVAAGDVARGFFDVTHNGLALMGTALAVSLIVLSARGDLRTSAEQQLLSWLMERQASTVEAVEIATDPTAIDRVTAAHPQILPEQQANVAFWLSKKYRVAPEPLTVLVAEAFEIGEKVKIDPTLILAVMAIESRFNPFAQSAVGAQGLMQVMTRVHTEKYEDFGGKLAAFDPLTNLRVGVMVLKDCIRRAGSVEGGLRYYVGAVTTDGSDYINKVMAEHQRLQYVALGKPVPRYIPPARPIITVDPAPAEPEAAPTESAALAPLPKPAAPLAPGIDAHQQSTDGLRSDDLTVARS
ncbi:lytic transglycosylase domain-containing protein [Hydrogenophaga sp.]|uniref:lytic transglycosylase domain-containing protein n=1 Tax=Hydrogenophaga sp. TaxID=1904254 RepID=UPI002724430D|nr:lytic transglycosylase domain-containing protein [Hydrogenophaga sp.]MDO8906855.1 lytic transglycosylase domain-containing protein [Hydrogenophaga sp.]